MSIEVNVFDDHKAEAELKKCPKLIRDYVRLLKDALKRQQELTGKAIGKIRELSAEKSLLSSSHTPPVGEGNDCKHVRGDIIISENHTYAECKLCGKLY